jgi:WD40 repeat protein
VTASDDKEVRFWDVDTATPRMTLRHRSPVSAFAFDRYGKRVLTGATKEGAQLWALPLGRRVGPGCPLKSDLVDVALSADGKIAVLADSSGHGMLWTLPEPVEGTPARITRWVQTAVGMKLDAGGGRQELDGPSWVELREQLQQLGGPP